MTELEGDSDRGNNKHLDSGYVFKKKAVGFILTKVKENNKILAWATIKWNCLTMVRKTAEGQSMREKYQSSVLDRLNLKSY